MEKVFLLLINQTRSSSDSSECPPRQCRLVFLCWMEGGSQSAQGCGYNSWLYSCCMKSQQNTVNKRNSNLDSSSKANINNNIPHKLMLKRHSEVKENFPNRRSGSTDNQLVPICGVPRTPSNVLQKRIIGGRPANFAEFPWQAHIRIREFQCGGGKHIARVQFQPVTLGAHVTNVKSEVV